MGVFMAIVGFPWHLIRWAYDIVRAGQLIVRLQAERQELQGLRLLRDRQMTLLQSGQHLILPLRFTSLHLNIRRPDAEPYVTVRLWLFNGSLFTIELQQPKFTAFLGDPSNPLAMASTLVSGSLILSPGTGTTYDFRQPIMTHTQEMLTKSVERHDRLRWQFRFEADCTVQETGGHFTFKPDLIDHDAIPFF